MPKKLKKKRVKSPETGTAVTADDVRAICDDYVTTVLPRFRNLGLDARQVFCALELWKDHVVNTYEVAALQGWTAEAADEFLRLHEAKVRKEIADKVREAG